MYSAIIIGGSAGSFKIISRIVTALPGNFPIPIIVCMHRLRNVKTNIADTFFNKSRIKICEPADKDPIKSAVVYIAPANYHLLIEEGNFFSLSKSEPVHYSRPSIDVTMKSAAAIYKENIVGILISGANSDGAEGMITIHKSGGKTIVQDPNEAEIPTMPESAIHSFTPDNIFNTDKIISFIVNLANA